MAPGETPLARSVRTSRRAWLIYAIGLLAYAAAVFQRSSLGVAGVEAQRRFGITAAVLSLFSVLQLAVYASLQVPVGVLLDRIGARRLIAAGALLMGTGQLVLATAHGVGLAVAGRVLVGAGDAMTFISVLRLVAVWFPPRRVPLMTQLTGLLGQIGQIAAAYPLVALLQGHGWTASFLTAAFVGLGIAVVSATAQRSRWLRGGRAGAQCSRCRAAPRVGLARAGDATGTVDALRHAVLGDGVRAAVGVPVPRRRRASHPG
jgi:MFS family permease